VPIVFSCEKCAKSLRVPDAAAGKQTRCPACGEVNTAPAGDEPVLEVVEKPATPRPELNPRRDVADDGVPLKLSDEPPPPRPKKKKKRRKLGPNRVVDHTVDAATKAYRNKQILYCGFGGLILLLGIPALIHAGGAAGGPLVLIGAVFIFIGVTGNFGDEDD
jgi:phage FluMu protein Com